MCLINPSSVSNADNLSILYLKKVYFKIVYYQTWKFGKFRETIHRRICTPCGNDETKFRFPQQILAEMICK